ncbi:hypothetical protein BC834DRAFT_866928 [Gloeopeniophorella convolvens]|nr:hypothetical protein BC834DRAFT_866928 [Gloeopeniophorella convolvens]
MEEAQSLVKTARQRRDHRAAWKYSDAVFTHREAMRALDAKAAEMAFKENNKGRKQGVIDLHGLYVSEAMSQVKLALESKSVAPRPDNTFRFITGQGRHSTGGAKIRPALQDFCTKKGLKHTLDSKNQGVVIVELAA